MPRKFSRDPLVRAAWAFGVATVVIAVLLFGKPSYTNASQPARGLPPGIAMQFAHDVQDVDLIIGESPSPDREVMRFKQYVDFAFIPAFAGLFVVLGLLVARSRKATGYVAAACGLAAGFFDILEDRAILSVLRTPLKSTSQAMIDAIRHASIPKWFFSVIAVVLLLNHYLRIRILKAKHESTS